MPDHRVRRLYERAALEVAVDRRGLEAVVVEERLQLAREVLAVRERHHERLLAARLRLEAHRHEQDLADAVVVEDLAVADEPGRRMNERASSSSDVPGSSREVLEDRHRDVEHELAARLHVLAHAREPLLHVLARVEMERRVESNTSSTTTERSKKRLDNERNI